MTRRRSHRPRVENTRYAPSFYSTRPNTPPASDHFPSPPAPVVVIDPHGESGPFSRGRTRRRPTVYPSVYGRESSPRHETYYPSGNHVYGGHSRHHVHTEYGYGRHAPGNADYGTAPPATQVYVARSPSLSPTRSRSPVAHHEPTLTPWARYNDDKYTDEWTRLASVFHEYEQAFVGDCKEDIDTLLVFVSSSLFIQLLRYSFLPNQARPLRSFIINGYLGVDQPRGQLPKRYSKCPSTVCSSYP